MYISKEIIMSNSDLKSNQNTGFFNLFSKKNDGFNAETIDAIVCK